MERQRRTFSRHFKELTNRGIQNCHQAKTELKQAGIEIKKTNYFASFELPTNIAGYLYSPEGGRYFRFTRNSNYYGVSGDIPLRIFYEVRQNLAKEDNIRAMEKGQVEKWASYRQVDLIKLADEGKIDKINGKMFNETLLLQISKLNPSERPEKYLDYCSVCTQEALNMLVKTLQEYGLAQKSGYKNFISNLKRLI